MASPAIDGEAETTKDRLQFGQIGRSQNGIGLEVVVALLSRR